MKDPDRYLKPEFEASALITIDTQVDFLDGRPLEIPGTTAVLPNMVRLLDAFRQAGRPIVHIVRIYRPDGSNVDICRRALVEDGRVFIAPGSEGSQLAPELRPHPEATLDHELLLKGEVQEIAPGEVIIYKPRWGAFYRTPLEAHLRGTGTTTLVFSGCNYPNCPRTSIYEAGERDFRLVLARDALSGLYDRGASELENIGVVLMTTSEIMTALTETG